MKGTKILPFSNLKFKFELSTFMNGIKFLITKFDIKLNSILNKTVITTLAYGFARVNFIMVHNIKLVIQIKAH